MNTCERCGTESPDDFRFCPACGSALAELDAPRQARKVVTALFCDVTGSTALGEELDPEVLRGVMNRYFGEIRAIIERHGGTVAKFIGDAVMAVFGIPVLHEDDALRAVRAAAEIRERVPAIAADVGVTLRFRTGVNTGVVLMGEGGNLAIGDAVNVAARLEQMAQPGEIVLGAETLYLVRDAVVVEPLGSLELKGKSEPVLAYRLAQIDLLAAGVARQFRGVLVGRERELRVLRGAWDRSVEEGGCHLFTLLGAAGVGKSRLVEQLLSEISGRAQVLRGRCLHYGEGITFWPLVEALMAVGEPARQILERLSDGGVAAPEELFWEVRRLLESLAADRPIVLYVDDLQWAEPMLLDVLDHVVDLSRGASILLLCTARPELLEVRPGWSGGKFNATTVLLDALGPIDCERLLDELGDGLDAHGRAQVIAASQGNPLFLEEMVALARESGEVTVPPTIHALLAARLEQLAGEERELLERGAVEGEVFHRLAVTALARERLATEVESRLAGLVRKELIRPHPATIQGDEAFRFRHLLIRDAAYDGLPKGTRAELHDRFAGWLEKAAPDLSELDEIVGWHLEQAVRYRRELGRQGDRALEERATAHLHVAGQRAGSRGDFAAARNLLKRALALSSTTNPRRTQIALYLAELLVVATEYAQVDELLSIAERDPDATAAAALGRLEWRVWVQPEGVTQTIESQLPGMLEHLAQAGDERGLARAHMLASYVHWLASRVTSAAEEHRIAAEHARNAGDEGLRSRALTSYLWALCLGPQHASAISAAADQAERDAPGPLLAAGISLARSRVAQLDGQFDDARRLVQIAIDAYAAMGNDTAGASYVAEIELTAGDPLAAIAALRKGDEPFAARGERARRSTLQAKLADASERAGDRQAALAAIGLSDELSAAEDVINYAITHGVRARIALADGDGEAAERWARSAVHHAFQTDQLMYQARAKLELAMVLAKRGAPDAARLEARAAVELFKTKGDRPGAATAQTLLEELTPGATIHRS